MPTVKHCIIHVPADMWHHLPSDLPRVCRVLGFLEASGSELNLTLKEEYATQRQLADDVLPEKLEVFGLEASELCHESGDDIRRLLA